MKAVLWGFKFSDMKVSWKTQMVWMVEALLKNGVEVFRHKDFLCQNLSHLPIYSFNVLPSSDICIYNHTDISFIIGNVLKSDRNWFFKPTVPTEFHTTLDELGYGPYSSITYEKPLFELMDMDKVEEFFKTKVADWIQSRSSKWGPKKFSNQVKIPGEDYYLILGQCGGDEVVTRHDFGNYFTKLEQVIRELVRIDKRQIIIKLHPYTDGENKQAGGLRKEHQVSTLFSMSLKKKYEEISSKVKVYLGFSNIHDFIPKARCVLVANSGAGFEVMMHHKPIISWGHPEYHWVTGDIMHLADLIRAIKLDWFDQKKQDKFLYWYLEKYCFYDQITADKRVFNLLDEKLKPFQGGRYV
jgi:hypothetical protein